jgi:hypothetical protein
MKVFSASVKTIPAFRVKESVPRFITEVITLNDVLLLTD